MDGCTGVVRDRKNEKEGWVLGLKGRKGVKGGRAV
jgi:hypothetical protein